MNIDGPIFKFYVGNPFANFFELEQSIQYATNWIWTQGSHAIKFGGGADDGPKPNCSESTSLSGGSFGFSQVRDCQRRLAGNTGLRLCFLPAGLFEQLLAGNVHSARPSSFRIATASMFRISGE